MHLAATRMRPSPALQSDSRMRIITVQAAEPCLTRWGFWCGQAYDFGQARDEMTSAEGVAEFDRATAFLLNCRRTRDVTAPRTSYGWKHVAERLAREAGRPGYVSNGMFLAAALALGFVVEREHPRSPNAYLNISRRTGS